MRSVMNLAEAWAELESWPAKDGPCCPMCGHALPDAPSVKNMVKFAALKGVSLTIVKSLARCYPEGLTNEQITEAVYGGKHPSSDTIPAFISYLRPRIRPLGWTIEIHRGVYRLEVWNAQH